MDSLNLLFLPVDILNIILVFCGRSTCAILYWTSKYFRPYVNNCMSKWDKMCQDACIDGNLEIIRWAIDNACPFSLERCHYLAVVHNHLTILQWALSHGYKATDYTCILACRYGHLTTLIWAKNNGAPLSIYCIKYAITGNRLDILEWLYKNGCELTYFAYMYAIDSNNPNIWEWLYENSCPINIYETIRYRAGNKNKDYLSFLQWAHNKKNLLQLDDIIITKAAAKYARLDILKWASTSKMISLYFLILLIPLKRIFFRIFTLIFPVKFIYSIFYIFNIVI